MTARLGGALAFVFFLALDVSPARSAQGHAEPAPVILAAGEDIPEFDAQNIDGSMRHVDYPKGGATVLLFLSSG